MRYVRILLLHLENMVEHRARSLVWFLIVLLNPLIMLLFWKGALDVNQGAIGGWQLSSIATYYFLLVIAGAFLMSHIEEDIAERDIQEGGLVKYLVRPFSYYWMKLMEETPYRVLQGFYGIIACVIFFFLFGKFFNLGNSLIILLLSIVITLLAYFLAHTFKVIIGLVSFWVIDIRGLYQLVEITIAIFAGLVVPIELLPAQINQLAYALPFAYMIYFPIVAFQGKLASDQLLQVIAVQISWLTILYLVYRLLWNQGIRKFTGVGQ